MNQVLQRAYLKALGIPLWVPSDFSTEVVVEAVTVPEPVPEIRLAEPPADTAALDWDDLSEVVRSCAACGLHAARTQAVFGVGSQQARLMVIGEAPGADEDREGEPFVGRAGQLLDEMLLAIELPRESVYIANIVKCRPPENRKPQHEEAVLCAPYLQRQIELVAPKAILAVGKVAAHNLLQTDLTVGQMRGNQYRYAALNIPVIVTYHPAYLLRSPKEKRKAWQDLKQMRTLIA